MANEFRYLTADVFTDEMFGGNQLAVSPDARGLDETTMQKIARELKLSETVFVLPAETPQGTRRLRIFTPGSELPFTGHPTVGTAFVLALIGEIPLIGERARVVFEEGVGPVEVLIEFSDRRPVFSQLSAARRPEEGAPPPATSELASVLSLEPTQILDGERRPRSFSCGVPYLFVTVRDLAALGEARVKIAIGGSDSFPVMRRPRFTSSLRRLVAMCAPGCLRPVLAFKKMRPPARPRQLWLAISRPEMRLMARCGGLFAKVWRWGGRAPCKLRLTLRTARSPRCVSAAAL